MRHALLNTTAAPAAPAIPGIAGPAVPVPVMDNDQRGAVRRAVTRHPAYAGYRTAAGRGVSAWLNSHLVTVAAAMGLDVAALIATATAATPRPHAAPADTLDADTDDQGDDDQGDDDAPAAAAVPDKADADVAAILAPLAPFQGASFMPAITAAVLDLARRANRPDIVRTVTVAGPPAVTVAPGDRALSPVDRREVRALFGRVGSLPANLSTDFWGAPDAEPLDPDYAWTGEILGYLLAAANMSRNVWLHGPRGTGKTTAGRQFSARTGRPCVVVPCSGHIEPADLFGSRGLRSGNTFHQEGSFLAAVQIPGCVIVLDEPSQAKPGTLAELLTALADRRVLLREENRVVPFAPGVVVIAADNTDGQGDASGLYAGASQMNSAFMSRFSWLVAVGYLDAKREARVVSRRAGIPLAAAALLVGFANTCRAKLEKGETLDAPGPRELVGLSEALMFGLPVDSAYKSAVETKMPEGDRVTIATLWTVVDKAALLAGLDPTALPPPDAAPAGIAPEFGDVE